MSLIADVTPVPHNGPRPKKEGEFRDLVAFQNLLNRPRCRLMGV